MTKIREESGAMEEPERPDGDAAGGAGRPGGAVAPDLQDAVTVAILARELAGGQLPGQRDGGGPR
jgi:hypothetical protein